MKKYIIIIAAIIMVISLTACGSKKKISLPEPEEIKSIKMMKNNSNNNIYITNEEEISKIINEISENSKGTNKESVNDQPTNIDEYIIVEFLHKSTDESSSIAYIYKNKGNTYIEQPYAGIWKLNKNTYEDISNRISE